MAQGSIGRRALLGGVLAAPLVARVAQAQAGMEAAAAISGPDRIQRLTEGARREGGVVVYGSAPVEDMADIFQSFERKYGVPVRSWRASSENVLQRAVTETRAGRFEADIFETNGPEMEAMHREALLQRIETPHDEDLLPAALRPHREWCGTRLNAFVAAYNTNLVRREEVPATYEGFLDARWRGRLGIEAEDHDWFAILVEAMGGAPALNLFREIVSRNGMSVRRGHTLLTNLVVSGEVPFSLTNYNYRTEFLKRQGAPIEWYVIPPPVTRVNGVGAARRSQRPHSAVLFHDFMLSDAQAILARRHFWATNRRVQALPPEAANLIFIDSARALDENRRWQQTWREVVTRAQR